MTDIFREVEEEVRRERYQKLWKKYGGVITSAAALIVIGAAGYQLWLAWDRSQREQASRDYRTANQMANAGRLLEAETAFSKLAENGPKGYATIAQFQLAAVLIAEGKRPQGLALYRKLAELDDPNLSGAARLRVAWTEAEYASREDIEKTLGPISQANNSWRYAANEVRAFVDLRLGFRDQAIKEYETLAREANAPQGIRDRAKSMAEFLKANPNVTSVNPPK